MNVLHIESSPRGSQSHSRQVADTLVQTLQSDKGASVTFRDLNHPSIPHVSQAWVDASLYNRFTGAPLSAEEQETLSLSHTLIAELKAADVIVLGVPMYNFGIPSSAKAWIDHISVMGETFQYGANGPEGMLSGKKVIAISARGGGGYSEGGPYNAANSVDRYLQAIFGFLGLTDVTVIPVEYTARGEEAIKKSVEQAHATFKEIVAAL